MRITLDQLQELTPSQQEKLRELWQPQIGDWFIHVNGEIEVVGYITRYNTVQCLGDIKRGTFASWDKEKLTPILSIGQCIELLQPHTKPNIMIQCYPYGFALSRYDEEEFYDGKELIDALWEAVKSIL